MKNIKKLMLGAVIALTALLAVVPVHAQDVTVYEGETSSTPVIELGNIQSTEGQLTLDDPDGILDLGLLSITANIGGSINLENGRVYLYTDGAAANATITFNAPLNSDAAANSCATFTYTAEGVTDANGVYSDSTMVKTASVCVVKRPDTPTPTPTPEPTPTPVPSVPTKPGTGVKVNYSALFTQVSVAEQLVATENSVLLNWTLSFAKSLMANKHQFVVDFGASLLEAVINGVN